MFWLKKVPWQPFDPDGHSRAKSVASKGNKYGDEVREEFDEEVVKS